MKGNFHVRFLGEGVAAMPLPYPTQKSGGRAKKASENERRRQGENGSRREGALGQSQSGREEQTVSASLKARQTLVWRARINRIMARWMMISSVWRILDSIGGMISKLWQKIFHITS
jgi:hypothetical protein